MSVTPPALVSTSKRRADRVAGALAEITGAGVPGVEAPPATTNSTVSM